VVLISGYAVFLARTRDVPDKGGNVREGLVVDGELSLLPPYAQTQNSRDVGSLLFRGLTRAGPDGRPEPELALKWDIDAQSQTYTFHLRPHLQWSDGKPLTSADALFTLSLLQSPALAHTSTGQAWSGIAASTPDPTTVVYTLPGSSGSFTTLASLGLLPQHALKDRPPAAIASITDAPTSGPFMVGGVARDRLRLVRNPRAFEPAWLDSIELRLYFSEASALQDLLAGDIDILAGLSPASAHQLARAPNRTVISAQSFDYVEVLFNQQQSFLSDMAVRRAITQSIDRKGIIADVYHGYAHRQNSPIPSAISWAVAKEPQPAYDLPAAGRALDRDGWMRQSGKGPRQKSGVQFILKLVALDADIDRAVARQVERELALVGISVRASFYMLEQLVNQLTAGNFDIALNPVRNGPDPDIYIFWHSSAENPPGFNFSRMPKDVFLDKDLEDGRYKVDIKTRHDAYADAQKILLENDPAVFVCSPDVLIGINNRVRGYRLYPAIESAGRFEFAQDWYVSKIGRANV